MAEYDNAPNKSVICTNLKTSVLSPIQNYLQKDVQSKS